MTQSEIKQYVYNFLYDKGLPHNSISAVMGNITAESGWDVLSIEVGSGVGFGLCQWSYGRREALEAYGTSLYHQCEFLWSELTGQNLETTGATYQWFDDPPESVTGGELWVFPLDDFLNERATIEDLTIAFCYCWERPAFETNHLWDVRIPSAIEFSATMAYKTIPTVSKKPKKMSKLLFYYAATRGDL